MIDSSVNFNEADFNFNQLLGSAGYKQENDDLQKKIPQTTKAKSKKFDFGGEVDDDDGAFSDEELSKKERIEYESMLKRDPLYEFFNLTCQSIKLNSPHINTICHIDTTYLYK